jgi:hypothetical protein
MVLFINVVRNSIYNRKRVEKSDWEDESEPPHVEIINRERRRERRGGRRGGNDNR